jgi:hypothetical protein
MERTELEIFLYTFLALEGKEEAIIQQITDMPSTKQFIVFVLQEQLFQSGEDGLGNSLGSYKPSTIKIKIAKGQAIDRVTLKDTGDFYKSYFIKTLRGGFIINANPIKKNKKGTTNLFTRYTDNILIPNTDSLETLAEFYAEEFIKYLENYLKIKL